MVSEREVQKIANGQKAVPHATNAETTSVAPTRGGLRYMAEGLAHDLNNVLAPIVTSVEVLRLTATDDRTRDILNLIERNARQGSAMVEQIPSLARGIDNAHGSVQMQSLLRDLRKFLQAALPKNITLEFKIATDLWPVMGSLAKLYQSLMNLCVNAGEAMPEGGTLEVRAQNVLVDEDMPFVAPGTQEARYVLITIKDTGKGISEELHERIFAPDYSTKAEERRGLGLYFVDTVVKAHDGHLGLESEIDRGTTFKLHLPAAPGESPPLKGESGLAPRGQGEWILMVDDEEGLLRVTKSALELFGYNVIAAANGVDAVAAYLQNQDKIKLVFTDIRMPVMDGITTLHELRKINPNLKLMATSAWLEPQQKLRAEEAGADRILPKPYQVRKLLQCVRDLLDEEPAEETRQASPKGAEANRGQSTLSTNDQSGYTP